MRARSALFDLYGDHLRPRGGQAPVAALVRLLAPVGITAPAVRTAVSRMVSQDWLRHTRLAAGPGYALTPKAVRRLDEAAARIYRTTPRDWDGTFDLLVVTMPAGRSARSRLAANLTFLGYGALDGGDWIAAHPADEVETLLTEAGAAAERFTARHAGGTAGAGRLVRRAWDLAALAAAYRDFVADLTPVVAAVGRGAGDEAAYAARFRLVHAWRSFLFRDPQLPPELLPASWPGTSAAAFFDKHAGRLRPAADRFVDRCLAAAPRPARSSARTADGPSRRPSDREVPL